MDMFNRREYNMNTYNYRQGGEPMATHMLLNFGTSRGGSRTFRIPHVRAGFLPADVQDAMEGIIAAADAFDENRGRPSTVRSATLVSVSSEPVDLG